MGSDSDSESFPEISPEEITIAIFCALSYETVAVRFSLDEEYQCRVKPIGPKKYIYSYGRIKEHKIVIAQPTQMGTIKAAQCAATVCQQFQNVRFALMVGIGAAIPNIPNCDIRLGDIAVSIPRDGHPGVLQYDFGKYEQENFTTIGCLNKPPTILLSAAESLKQDAMMGKNPVRRLLKKITEKPGFSRPNTKDVLFEPTFHHINKGKDCTECEISTEKKTIDRPERGDPHKSEPLVYHGLILSGNGVIKNPTDRDTFRRGNKDAICFEMEAAGIMDEIPCLVIRGICDYADTHKQDGWHHYAAAAAAAYAKAILRKIDSEDVAGTANMKDAINSIERRISEIGNDVQELKNNSKFNVSEHQQKLLQWLSPIDHIARRSGILRNRQEGTGNWFLQTPEFQAWLDGEEKNMFVSGIPGAGKTMIASIVANQLQLDTLLPRDYLDGDGVYPRNDKVGVVSLYFVYQEQERQTSDDMLASLLAQLTLLQESIPKSIQKLYEGYLQGKMPQLSHEDVSQELSSILKSYSRIYIILDALDESKPDIYNRLLMKIFKLQSQFDIRLMTTFRPNITPKAPEKVVKTELRACGEDIELYLDKQVLLLPIIVQRDDELQSKIKTRISTLADGMFLLAQLYINTLTDKLRRKDIETALANMQKGEIGLKKAYSATIDRIKNQQPGFRDLGEKVIHWVVHAKRQLTTQELRYALAIEPGTANLGTEDLYTCEDLVSSCAGLVTIDPESDKVRLVHKTTQEYFRDNYTEDFPNVNKCTIAITCLTCLSFDIPDMPPASGVHFPSWNVEGVNFNNRVKLWVRQNPFVIYAIQNWVSHTKDAQESVSEPALNFLRDKTRVRAAYHALYGDLEYQFDGMHLTALFGLSTITKKLLELDPGYANIRDEMGRTPLFYAVERSNYAAVELLLEYGAKPESADELGQTPLCQAISTGDLRIIEKLFVCGVRVNFFYRYRLTAISYKWTTPLAQAKDAGNDAVEELLLKYGAREDIGADSPEDGKLMTATNAPDLVDWEQITARNGLLGYIGALRDFGVKTSELPSRLWIDWPSYKRYIEPPYIRRRVAQKG